MSTEILMISDPPKPMKKTDASRIRLAPGHKLPGPGQPPVYWMIWVFSEGKPYHSRVSRGKHFTATSACNECYGLKPTRNMMFFNLTSNVSSMRRMMAQTRELWVQMGGYEG